MINIQNLHKNFGEVKALSDVSFSLDKGDFMTISGPSGCGKSTLMMTLGAMLRPDSGDITILDQTPYSLSKTARADFRRSNIGFVFQQFHLMPYLNIYENIITPDLASPTDSKIANALIEEFGLKDRLKHKPSELSVGEQQRVALARALLTSPKILLADEPTGALDQENTELVINKLKEYADKGNCVIMVSHDPTTLNSGNKQLKLSNGQITK